VDRKTRELAVHADPVRGTKRPGYREHRKYGQKDASLAVRARLP
jgi:hypothetical protein